MNEYDENHPDLQAHFNEFGYSRPTLFDKIDPAKTEAEVRGAAEKVREMMDKTGLRHVVVSMQIGDRHHVKVMTDEFLKKEDAPPEYVDGVYVGIGAVTSLDHWLGPRQTPSVPGGPAP